MRGRGGTGRVRPSGFVRQGCTRSSSNASLPHAAPEGRAHLRAHLPRRGAATACARARSGRPTTIASSSTTRPACASTRCGSASRPRRTWAGSRPRREAGQRAPKERVIPRRPKVAKLATHSKDGQVAVLEQRLKFPAFPLRWPRWPLVARPAHARVSRSGY